MCREHVAAFQVPTFALPLVTATLTVAYKVYHEW